MDKDWFTHIKKILELNTAKIYEVKKKDVVTMTCSDENCDPIA